MTSTLVLAATLFLHVLSSANSVAAEVTAIRANDFLNSIGANSAIGSRGERIEKTIECAKYLGLRWFRTGTENRVSIQDLIEVHKLAAVRFSWSPGSGRADIDRLIETGRQLAAAGALLAFEGPNEPNNWGITYHGEKGGGKAPSWIAVAKLQRDLCQAVKSDPALRQYPVWSISEGGAQADNVGLQFLTIPPNAGTLMPDGTQYADYANVHNYVYHPNSPRPEDNKTWNASDPTSSCKVDGLYGEYGVTWRHHYRGYSENDLLKLPRVTTETGCLIQGAVTEHIHALNLLSLYLDQFKRGWSYTAVYLLRDRVDEGGNQKFGFYKPDYTPREAAVYLHNLTSILADPSDPGAPRKPGKLDYSIPDEPPTVHDLLLQKGDGTFELVVWGELVNGSTNISVRLAGKNSGVKLYDPTVGASPVREIASADRLVTLSLSDHPMLVELGR